MKKILTAALVCLSSLTAMAFESGHAIEIKTDKIVINTDSLHLPKSTTALEVLNILPELVERDNDFVFNNYTIQINGKTVGSARDAVLNQIRISDLKCIEVSENSLSAISAMGQGGSISLELRTPTKKASGSVNAEVTTEANYAGGIRLDNKSGKWTFQSIATIENYVPSIFKSSAYDIVSNYPTQEMGLAENIKQRDFTEYVSTFINFTPTVNDLLKFHISEVYTNSRQYNDFSREYNYTLQSTGLNNTRTRNIDVFAAFNYEHTFPTGGKLCAEINYRYVPEKNDKQMFELTDRNTTASIGYLADRQDYNYNHQAHNVFGELKLEQPLINPTATTSAKMELGAQYNYSTADNTSENTKKIIDFNENATSTSAALSTVEDIYFLRPYIKLEARFNKWQFMGNIDYQHFSYQTNLEGNKTAFTSDMLDNDLNTANHKKEDFTGQLVAMFSPNKNNMLRLRYIHSINRPTSTQLFPYSYTDPTDINIELIGNPDLVPSKQNAIDLDYAFDLSTESYNLEIKASVEYSHTFDGIGQHAKTTESGKMTYYNMEKTDVIMGDLGIYFRKGIFSTWFSGNIYHNYEKWDFPDTPRDGSTASYKDHYTYYNLLLRPVLNFKHGWIVTASLIYNSPITDDYELSDHNFYGGLRVGKKWGHFNIYIYGKQNFSGKTHVTYYNSPNSYVDKDYMHSAVGLGVNYRF